MELLRQVCEKMGLAGTVVPDEEHAAARILREKNAEGLEMALGFLGDVVALGDPGGIRSVKML
jgi:hypothetical protein